MNYKAAIEHILNKLAKDLPSNLYYHGHHHTIDVLEATERIARHEGVSELELNLLLVAAAFHDSGFLFGHEEHEVRGCELAKQMLPDFGFDSKDIEQICKMIMATKVPQTPTGTLSDILCDADLDYLGRDDFEPVASSLFQELKLFKVITEEEVWNRIQVKFLSEHYYHTSYGKTFRQPGKELNLDRIKQIVDGYDK